MTVFWIYLVAGFTLGALMAVYTGWEQGQFRAVWRWLRGRNR